MKKYENQQGENDKKNTPVLPWVYELTSRQKLCKPEGSGRMCFKWWKGKTYNQEYSTQQAYHSDLREKSKAFQTSKSQEFNTIRKALQQIQKELL